MITTAKKIKPVVKNVIVPDDVIPAVWLSKQAEIFKNEVKARRAVSQSKIKPSGDKLLRIGRRQAINCKGDWGV